MTAKIRPSKKNLADRKSGPLGTKMAIFGQKHQVLAKSGDLFWTKNFKNFFALKYILDHSKWFPGQKFFFGKFIVPLIFWPWS